MDRAIKTLEKLGLTPKQSVVYLALLELGESSMSDIARKSNLKRPTVYLIIEELNLLGLSSEITKGKKKFYSATHPKRLVEITNFRSKQAETLLPHLVARQKSANKPKVRMLEGLEGVRIAYQEAFAGLNNKEEGLWIGDTGLLQKNFPEVLKLYNEILGKLDNPKIRELIHGDEDSKKWTDEMNAKNMKNYEARYINNSSPFGNTDQLIIDDKIMTFAIGKEIFVMIVESKDIAQTQRALFETIWNNCK